VRRIRQRDGRDENRSMTAGRIPGPTGEPPPRTAETPSRPPGGKTGRDKMP